MKTIENNSKVKRDFLLRDEGRKKHEGKSSSMQAEERF